MEPSADKLPKDIEQFLAWLHTDAQSQHNLNLVLKAEIANLWFVTIHPINDVNSRLTRAITKRILAQSDNSPQRFIVCRHKS